MPVHNADLFLKESIESILNQTYANFEFILVDDASQDNSLDILENYAQKDPRICLLSLKKQSGISQALNEGINLAQGKYIVRMDADDICTQDRLSKQVEFMENNPQIDVCGSWYYEFSTNPSTSSKTLCRPAIHHEDLLIALYFKRSGAFLKHPSVIIRRDSLLAQDLHYDPQLALIGDRELWYRLSQTCIFANIPQALLYYRIHPQQSTNLLKMASIPSDKKIRLKYFQTLFPQLSEEDMHLFIEWQYQEYTVNQVFLKKMQKWFVTLHQANEVQNFFSPEKLKYKLGYEWFLLLNEGSRLKLSYFWIYLFSPLRKFYPIGLKNSWNFFKDCYYQRPSTYLNATDHE